MFSYEIWSLNYSHMKLFQDLYTWNLYAGKEETEPDMEQQTGSN